MSMTREHALAETTRQLGNARDTLKTSKNKAVLTATANKIDYLTTVQAALRGPTREMVERMRGEWIRGGYACGEHEWECSKCHGTEWRSTCSRLKFCPFCGAPMTDEAVDMVIKRLEAMRSGKEWLP